MSSSLFNLCQEYYTDQTGSTKLKAERSVTEAATFSYQFHHSLQTELEITACSRRGVLHILATSPQSQDSEFPLLVKLFIKKTLVNCSEHMASR